MPKQKSSCPQSPKEEDEQGGCSIIFYLKKNKSHPKFLIGCQTNHQTVNLPLPDS
jgi:hypothetical protein